MADFGLKILNDSGKVQIDSIYSNYALLEKGNITPVYDTSIPSSTCTWNISFYMVTLTFSKALQQAPIVVIKPAYGAKVAYLGMIYDVVSGCTGCTFISNTTDLIGYAVYCPTSELDLNSETHGMRIKNGNGDIVFDSGFDYMNILEAIQDTTVNTTYYHPSNVNAFYSVGFFNFSQQFGYVQAGIEPLDASSFKCSYVYPNSITWGTQFLCNYLKSSLNMSYPGATLVCDVRS
jgi:hypothetical protein